MVSMLNAIEGDEITVAVDPYLVTERGRNLGKRYEDCKQYTGRVHFIPESDIARLEMEGGYVMFDVDDALQLTGPVD
jgi:hypothetical protein